MGQILSAGASDLSKILSSCAQINGDSSIFGLVWRTFTGFPRLWAENFSLVESQVKRQSSLQVAADSDGECDRAARMKQSELYKDHSHLVRDPCYGRKL
jgi:hypothetical protein